MIQSKEQKHGWLLLTLFLMMPPFLKAQPNPLTLRCKDIFQNQRLARIFQVTTPQDHTYSAQERKKIKRNLKAIQSAKSLGSYEIALMKLFDTLKEKDSRWQRFKLLAHPQQARDSYLIENFKHALIKKGIHEAAALLDLKPRIRDRLMAYAQKRVRGTFKALINSYSALNLVSGDILGVAPPQHKRFKPEKDIPDAIFEKAITHDLDSVKEDLKKIAGSKAMFDVYYNALARVLTVTTLGFIVNDIIKETNLYLEEQEQTLKEETQAKEKRDQVKIETVKDTFSFIQQSYDFTHPEKAFETLWDDQRIEEEELSGRTFDQNSAEYKKQKAAFIEAGLWGQFSETVIEHIQSKQDVQSINKDSLWEETKKHFQLKQGSQPVQDPGIWEERKKEFLQQLSASPSF